MESRRTTTILLLCQSIDAGIPAQGTEFDTGVAMAQASGSILRMGGMICRGMHDDTWVTRAVGSNPNLAGMAYAVEGARKSIESGRAESLWRRR